MKPFLGNYVFGSGFDADAKKIATDIKQSGIFGGDVRHLFTPWSGEKKKPYSRFPFRRINGKLYDLKTSARIDTEWRDQLRETFYWFARKGLKLQVCFFDVYAEDGANWGFGAGRHPFRNNNTGWEPSDDLRKLYSNKPWEQWIDTMSGGNEKDPKTYKPIGDHGSALFEYVDTVVEEFDRIKKTLRPKWKLFIRTFNEEKARHSAPHSGLGDESKIDRWLQYRFKMKGYKAREDFIMTNDFVEWDKYDQPPAFPKRHVPHWSTFRGARAYVNMSLRGLQEVHGVHGKVTYDAYVKNGGCNDRNTWYSMDAVKPEDASFFKKAKEVLALNKQGKIKFCDIKFWGPNWYPTNVQKSWNDNFDWFCKQLK